MLHVGAYAKCEFNKIIRRDLIDPLKKVVMNGEVYLVSDDNDDGTYFDRYTFEELRLDFSVMVDALLKFNSLYKEQLYNLSQIGKVEVHFGILNTDE
jgi:hypothetical protein